MPAVALAVDQVWTAADGKSRVIVTETPETVVFRWGAGPQGTVTRASFRSWINTHAASVKE